MKKLLSVFAFAGLTALVACGPSAEEIAKKEQATKDSIAAVEKARQDSLDAVMKDQARLDSIATATADSIAAAATASAAAPKAKGTPKKKETPKLTPEEKTSNAMEGRRGGTTPTTPADVKKVEEIKEKMNSRRK